MEKNLPFKIAKLNIMASKENKEFAKKFVGNNNMKMMFFRNFDEKMVYNG
jgi:hypothetical protein